MEAAMSFYADTQTRSRLAWLVNAFRGLVKARVRQVGQMLKNRRDAVTLASLDERMLADIGLTRGDVRDAFSEPVWRDPTAILVSRAKERRVNRRPLFGPSEAPSIVPPQGGPSRARVDARYY